MVGPSLFHHGVNTYFGCSDQTGLVQNFNDSFVGNEQGDKGYTAGHPWNERKGLNIVQGSARPIAEAMSREVTKELKKALTNAPSTKGNRRPFLIVVAGCPAI